MNQLFDLKGKTALITGSGSGLGLAIAGGLAVSGASIVLNGRNEDKLATAEEELKANGANVCSYPFDVTNSAQIAEQSAKILKEVGTIDILINNAGIQRRAKLAEMEEADWRIVIDTHMTGAFLLARHFVPAMIQQGAGKIINMCSLMSEIGRETTGNYAAAKGGLKMLTRAMAVEWAKHNIQINAIGPGYFLTEMTQVLADNPEFDSWLKKRTPAGRWGDPGELIGAAVFLASQASNFVNGQVIYVDGGILASL